MSKGGSCLIKSTSKFFNLSSCISERKKGFFSFKLTVNLLENALEFIKKVVSNDGKILFVGTKLQANNIVKKYALECNQFYVNKRWLGGMLTNWTTISNSINHLNMVLALDQEFDITLEFDEVLSIEKINDIYELIGKKVDNG